MKIDPVRLRAWEILVEVEGRGELDPLLERAQGELSDRRDRAFLAGLVRGTLQWQGRYDYLLDLFAARKRPRDPRLLCLLRLGLHQLLGMSGVPAFAAIDQTVSLCRSRVDRRRSGFVNGLLRNIQRRVQADGGTQEASDRLRELFKPLQTDPRAFLAAWHSHPRWLVDAWSQSYGEQATARLLEFNNLPVPLDLRVPDTDQRSELAAILAAAGFDAVCLPDVPGCLRVGGRPGRELIRDLLGRHRRVIVQDAGVQAATAWLAAALEQAPEGLPVADLCAAPGGKTVHLGSLAGSNRLLVAMEPDAVRMRLLASTVGRTGTCAALLRGDGLAPPLAGGSCGAVLLDGPCSGSGVLRRHPEARWRLSPAVVRSKARLLGELARRAVELLAPGGVLLYATCSLQVQENREVVAQLLRERPQLAGIPDEEGVWQRTWLPPDGPGDGFFAARLRKRPD